MGFADCGYALVKAPMSESRMSLAERREKHVDGNFLRAVTKAVLQLIMGADVEGVIGIGRHDRMEARPCEGRFGLEPDLRQRSGTGLWPTKMLVVPGPLLPFARLAIAVVQLHQTGNSSIVQHFRRVKVGSADEAGFRCGWDEVGFCRVC
ncbi:hypothetical protein LX81_03990 [Palleronia aestuarii]|uniref:Uncharacterized protein n=1 Tax=Palleronia aestuarii TaxID=568105 RepID=A0A2W7MTL7_9RHOB|nr:hypothetical protein LX81_03990 [Palleronia aestuarii]